MSSCTTHSVTQILSDLDDLGEFDITSRNLAEFVEDVRESTREDSLDFDDLSRNLKDQPPHDNDLAEQSQPTSSPVSTRSFKLLRIGSPAPTVLSP
jgi:hypothetical protein